jgi:membrane protein insertase Oxa1/YidC/SpoIIIJ
MVGIKMKMLAPDIEECQANIKKFQVAGNKEAAKAEANKVKVLRRKHGIYPMLGLLNLLQIPIHISWASLINS